MKYELSGSIKDCSLDFKSGKTVISLMLNERENAMNLYNELSNTEKLSIKIDKYREKRSLNSNAYAWKLITEIANELLANKEDIYFLMLQRYGQSEVFSVQDFVPFEDYVKYCIQIGESTLNGKKFKHYRAYKGSSEFDTREMSIFIDGIVSEAKALGIPTETPETLAKMKSLWVNE